MIALDLTQFLISMLLIYFSAELIVRYGKIIAISIGVSKYIIGLTLIAFGTSFPEFVVSINASIINESSVAYGNLIGSNIANIAFVLSVCAIIRMISTNNVQKEDLIFFLVSAFLTVIFALDGKLNQFEGLILLSGFAIYCYRIKKNLSFKKENKNILKSSFDIYLTIIMASSFFILVTSSNLFIDSALSLAEKFNISTVAISMTIVAIGTSLPELATSVIAVAKKEYNLLLGNIIGSNIMNLLMILGTSSIINNIQVDVDYLPLILMIALTVFIYLFSIFNIKISRIIGLILLIIFSTFLYTNFQGSF